MKSGGILQLAWSLAIAIGQSAAASETGPLWLLYGEDLEPQTATVVGLDEKDVEFRPQKTSDTRRMALESFVLVQRPREPVDSPSAWVLYLAGGDCISGSLIGLKDERLRWKSPVLGELAFSVRQVRVMAKAGVKPGDGQRVDDLVQLTNGDSRHGIVIAADEVSLTLRENEAEAQVLLDTAGAVYFASTEAQAKVLDKVFCVSFNDGSLVTAVAAQLKDGQLRLSLPGQGVRLVDIDGVFCIEQLNGPVSWLSERQPVESVQIPYVGQRQWPAQRDRNVTGGPIRLGDKEYARGIGVHAYSRLVYPLDGQFRAFRTQYAIDGTGSYADVVVRIKLDDRVVHEEKDFHGGVLSPVVVLELGGAKTLTLEVDYGRMQDVQDRFNWIESALLRRLPTTTPSLP